MKVPKTPDNAKKCLCPTCPTYLSEDCPKNGDENLFCAAGKSKCDLPEKGCFCGACPIWTEYGLSGGYFCLNGEAQ